MKLIIDGKQFDLRGIPFVTKDMPDSTRIKGTVSLFYTMMEKLRKDFNVKKLYVVWDGREGPNWRKEIPFPEYKANRTNNPQLRKMYKESKQ